MIPGTLRPSRWPRSLTVAGVRWPLRWVVRQRQAHHGLEVHGPTVMAAQAMSVAVGSRAACMIDVGRPTGASCLAGDRGPAARSWLCPRGYCVVHCRMFHAPTSGETHPILDRGRAPTEQR